MLPLAARREFVHEQTVRVLEEVGIGYNTPAAIDLLERGRRARSTATALTRASCRGSSWSAASHLPAAGAAGGARPAARRRRRATARSRSAPTAPATYMLDDVTGRRRRARPSGCAGRCACTTRCPRWTTRGRPSRPATCDPLTAGLEIEASRSPTSPSTSRTRSATRRTRRRCIEIFEAVAGGSLWDRPVFSTINCTVAPLQHEREMTEATMALVARGRAGAGAAHAAHRHDGADDRARHDDRQHGRTAQRRRALPARPARLRHHLGHGRRRGRHAQRPVSVRHAGVRAHERRSASR